MKELICIPYFQVIPFRYDWNTWDIFLHNIGSVAVLCRMGVLTKLPTFPPRKSYEEIIQGLQEARNRMDQIAR